MEARFPEYTSDPYQDTTTHYRQLLKEFGSKENSHKSKKKDIAILGAGISGLLAGFLLRYLGHTVRIYEASNTVGGRIKTLRDRFTAGYYAEAGAMRIPRHHTLVLDLCCPAQGRKIATGFEPHLSQVERWRGHRRSGRP
jgi:hypothetical protein